MHVPDGFINAPVSALAGAVAVGAVAVSLRGARRELAGTAGSLTAPNAAGMDRGERAAPLAGLVAAFIFAVQMLNFPVAAGTSGHLLGGALAAILVGPYTGVLCVSVVLLMQGVLFADGGLTALGVNISDMAVTTTLVAYVVFRGLVKVLPRGRRSVTIASFVAALVSVPAAAAVFSLLYAVGGTTDVPIGKVVSAMVGVHVLIGIGEAVITALTVGAVMAVRPDLVYGARGLARPLKLRVGGELIDAPGPGSRRDVPAATRADVPAATRAADSGADLDSAATGSAASGPTSRPAASGPTSRPAASDPVASGKPAAPRSHRKFWLTGLATSLVLAGFVSFYASANPDGLEKVAHDKGIDATQRQHAAEGSPLAGYGVKDIADARISGGLAGVIGVGFTVVAGTGVFWALRRRRSGEAGPTSVSGQGTPGQGTTGHGTPGRGMTGQGAI